MLEKTVTVKQIQKLDRVAIDQWHVPSLFLMENAGRSVANEVLRRLKKKEDPSVCVICGLGNNAGDGFVISRYLINAGIYTTIFLIGEGKKLKTDAFLNYQILKNHNYPIVEIKKLSQTMIEKLMRNIARAHIVIDAIFGVGLNREVLDPFKTIISLINHVAKKRNILSVDIPSGLNGTTGKVHGICVKAWTTVTFTFAKKGFLKAQGPDHTGRVIVADKGITKELIAKSIKR